jgi:hypothetical protein
MLKTPLAFAALLALAALPAPAQTLQGVPTRIRGTIENFAGHSLVVDARGGGTLTITLAPKFSVLGVARRRLADLKPGDYVGVTSVTGKDGRQHAVEVHILPASLHGAAEGQHPWDLMPHSLMTNATVARVTSAPDGHVLHLAYKGSAPDLVIGPKTTIVGYVPGDPRLLKPKAAVFVPALKLPDGGLVARLVIAEKTGVKPPL